MNKKDIYLEYKLKLYFELKKYLESTTNKNNYFYCINQENFYSLKDEFSFLNTDVNHFLEVYFNQDIEIKDKLKLLEFQTKNDYYSQYRKIIKTISERSYSYGNM